MIRIMHVISDANIGGAGYQLISLLEGMDRDFFDTKVVLPQNSMLIKKISDIGVCYEEMPYLAAKSFSVKACCLLYKKIKSYRPHLVHAHAALSARIAAKIYGKCNIVHTRHSVYPLTKKQKALKRLIGLAEDLLGGRIIAVSPAAMDNLTQMGVNKEKIEVIFNGVKQVRSCSDEERLIIKNKYKLPSDVFIVAKIARLTGVKGHDYVLDAAKETDAVFLLAGDGDRLRHLEARVNEENITNVQLLGHVGDISEIINIMDVQVMASFGTEATSLSLLEGMSLGKPAIVTDYGGNPYVIEDGKNGLVVPAKSAVGLRNGISKLMNDRDFYDSCCKGAKEIYENKFTANKMVSKTMELYKKLLGGYNA